LPRGRRSDADRGPRRARPALEASSGNVYLDLGFPPPEAEYLALRSRLMLMLERLIASRKLTQVEAARLLGVSQPRVSDVVRGRVERFTIDALVEMLARAGVQLDIVVLPGTVQP
jgi:predicted XRE-type DNA-binding protein